MNDDFLFADDDEPEIEEELGHWKILVVDDEPEVHAVTKLALSDFVLNDKSLVFLSAYDGDEARQMFREHDDIAVVLLDVVMESDDAGLKVADFIRNDMDNHFTRIILRTGQPGQAPEKDVIINYDINDYKSKTELTAQKLFTVIIAALRSYRDIMVIEDARSGLEKILDASTNLFTSRSLERFMQGIIQQLASILGGSKDAAYITSAVAAPKRMTDSGELYIFAGNGEYAGKEGVKLHDALPSKEYNLCKEALEKRAIVYADEYLVAYCDSDSLNGSLLFLTGLPRRLSDIDKRLVQKFADNVQVAFDNILMNNEIEETQREVIERLGKAMEFSEPESNNLKRLTAMAEVVAKGAKLSFSSIRLLKLAIPLLDIGSSRVSEQILNKAGPLTEDEKLLIRQHAEFGYNILKNSERPTIKLAALLAKEHHEKWDGSGYPDGMLRTQIAIESRIATLVDVFDALYNSRPYKPAWPLEKVIATIKSESGKHFDPHLVEILLENIDAIERIQTTLKDGRNIFE